MELFVIEGWPTRALRECQVEGEWQGKGDRESEYLAKERRWMIRETGELPKYSLTEIKGGTSLSRKEVLSSLKCPTTGEED